MPAGKQPKINLLPQEEFEASTWGRILAWALSGFRIIVIVTEMVVMIAFLSRFWLDARNSDLGESIKEKQALVSAQAAFEKNFRLTQKRLKIFSELSDKDPSLANIVASFASYIPSEVLLSNYSFSQDTIQVRGTAPSEISVSQLVANLEASGKFSEVTVTSISQSSEDEIGFLRFSLVLSPKKGGRS